jgi:Family of unknown function (DUF6088)
MNKHADSNDAAILDRIRSGPKDRVWTPADFLDLGSRAAIDQALSRNCKSGLLRRAGRGMYHIPKHHPILGVLGPGSTAFHDAITRKDNSRILSTGAHAANALGLTDQVPMRPMLLTTGRSRRVKQGKGELILRHVSPRFVSTKNPQSAQVILALRWIGKRFVDDDIVARLRRNLSPSDRDALLADAACAPAWIVDVFRRVVAQPKSAS